MHGRRRLELVGEGHDVDTGWRELTAQALEARGRSLEEWIEHAVELEEQAELVDDAELVAALRSVAAIVRDRRDRLVDEALSLRMRGRQEPPA